MNYDLLAISNENRYYVSPDGYKLIIEDSKTFPSYYVQDRICKELGIDLRAFTSMAMH